jgi:hypothetical protein
MSVAAQDMRDDLNWSESEKGLVLVRTFSLFNAFKLTVSLVGILLGIFYRTDSIIMVNSTIWCKMDLWFQVRSSIPLLFSHEPYSYFFFSVLIPSILTLFVPLACRASFGLSLFIRALIGFFESASFPAVFHFFPIWIPLQEKTLMIPAIASGMYMGEIIGFSLSGVLTNWSLYINDQYWGGWQSVFYVFGLTGILWFPYWALFAYESPDKHPKVKQEELDMINEGKGYTAILREAREEESEGKKLLSSVLASPEFEHPYNSPLIESVNPISRFADRSVSIGEDPVYRFDIDNVSNTSLQTPIHVEEREEQRIDGYTKEDFVNNIPWKEFFTHPVSLTLFFNGWSFVSVFIFLSSFAFIFFLLSARGLFLLPFYQKCHLFSLII